MDHQVPKGFTLAGVHCGIKTASQQNDLALFVAETDSVSGGMYTTNLVHSANVDRNDSLTPAVNCRAIAINSGNANACTGKRGIENNQMIADLVASAIGATADQVLVLSTGIIGHFLPMENISTGISQAVSRLSSDADAINQAASGILTTDTRQKIVSRIVDCDGVQYRILGFAKGAGMIGPNMATMLSVILTDAPLTAEEADASLRSAVDQSFNCVSVDGHMSTSDSCLMLASGAADGANAALFDLDQFSKQLTDACQELAREVASDGEGATHLVTIDVSGCATETDARMIARTIANSALVKTAISGHDPNWGRIVSAAGYAGVDFDPTGCSLTINGTTVYADAMPTDFNAEAVSRNMRDNHETQLQIGFSEGNATCRFWTCDLTAEYVRINADYHT